MSYYQAYESIFYKYIYFFIATHQSLFTRNVGIWSTQQLRNVLICNEKVLNKNAVLHTFYRICLRERERNASSHPLMMWRKQPKANCILSGFAREQKNITIFHSIFISFLSLRNKKWKCCRKTHRQRERESIKSEARSCVPKWSYNNVDEIMLIKSGYEEKGKASTATMTMTTRTTTTTAAAKISTTQKWSSFHRKIYSENIEMRAITGLRATNNRTSVMSDCVNTR